MLGSQKTVLKVGVSLKERKRLLMLSIDQGTSGDREIGILFLHMVLGKAGGYGVGGN